MKAKLIRFHANFTFCLPIFRLIHQKLIIVRNHSQLPPAVLCEMLSIGKNAAYKILAAGELKAFRYNRVWKIPKDSIIEYIKTKSNLS